MKTIKDYPPNIDLLRLSDLKPTENTIFCYGDTIYNPSGKEILQDIIEHEKVHSKQQGYDIDGWYYKYITDKQFRLNQEIEAYGQQYKFNQEHIKDKKLLEWRLESMASALSGEEYNLGINFAQAKSKIRNYAKEN